jgi:HAD superfamily hydrolase (TIGR01549 family)
MGGTLRSTTPLGRQEKREAIRGIMALIGAETAADEFAALLAERARAYKRWSEQTLVELDESELWTRWMLPDWPVDKIKEHAVRLNLMYRAAKGTRKIFPETYAVVLELFRRGYRMGLVSNTTSSVEVPTLLNELRLSGCFEVVVLSAVVGKRKPDPAILLGAAAQIGVAPEKCAYIGDRPDRDVAAARKAGFSKTVVLESARPLKPGKVLDPLLLPDERITNLNALLDIFPRRSPPQPLKVYQASLSTMWGVKNFPSLPDFFEFARRAGFASVELNHKVDSSMLADIDLTAYSFSSVHEPCPADISVETLKKQDWLVSARNEEDRQQGVKAVQRSIDIAHQLGVSTIVVHVGHAQIDPGMEKQLHTLYDTGLAGSDAYRQIQNQMIQDRAACAAAGLDAVNKSLQELLAYAGPFGIRLGLENRFHYMEYPSPDELGMLLQLAGPDRLGFIFDVGHAQHLSRLGFYPFEEWLLRFAPRIIGAHLHDVVGLKDHYSPGLGDVDFDQLAAYLPEDAFRTLELMESISPIQMKAGVNYLFEHSCIKEL